MSSGQPEAALAAFAACLAEAPDFADAAQNLGCCQAALGRLGDAAASYATVVRLRPADAGAQFNLGCVLLAANEFVPALAALRAAVRPVPRTANHHMFLAMALSAGGQKAASLLPMPEAPRLDPANPTILANLAGLLVEEGRMAEAAAAAGIAVQLAPADATAQANLARALHGLGRTEEALRPAIAAVRLAPEDGGAAATLGAVQYMLGAYPEAVAECRRASRIAPGLFQACANEAVALEALGALEEAEQAGRRAVAIAPAGNAEVRHNLACMLLRAGRMTSEAWELYEWRLHLTGDVRRFAGLPRWAGETMGGGTVLLHAEQGFGDSIQFARYASLVQRRGARVMLAVQPALLRLLEGMEGADAVVPLGQRLPAFDAFCPLLSLPGVFATTLDTIPSPTQLGVRHVRKASDRLQVGLVWAGSPAFIHDRARSIPVAQIAPLFDVPGVDWHSLQMEGNAAASLPIMNRMGGVSDFADTAAVVAGLDLVVAVDSSVAHLAASMGKPVWLLSRFLGCWRWLHARVDSPWYPTMQIYRQPSPGDWASVIARVRTDLMRFAMEQSVHRRVQAA